MSGAAVTRNRPSKRLMARGIMALYLLFLLVPIYWLVIMSFKSNAEILGAFTLFPKDFTLDNYRVILTDPSWYMGYVNSFI
ncbi:MAG: carbohydrate ABC transporter permease, partial [Pseudomonadota bacterium]